MRNTPIWQKKEIPGFAGNYLHAGLAERARYLVENGYCTVEEVDIALEYGFNHKMGVFRMNDLTGIDLSYTLMKANYERTGKKPTCSTFTRRWYRKAAWVARPVTASMTTNKEKKRCVKLYL